MTDELANIEMDLEVTGRSPSQWMSLSDITWVLREVRRYCDAHRLTVGGSPMPKSGSPPIQEVFTHPQAAEIIRSFHELWGLVEDPVLTSGIELASRPDWRGLLETMRSLGTSTLWFAFYGAGTIHDWAVRHQGAYHESLHAIELTREAGMRAGCNLFITTRSIPQFEQIVLDLQRAGIQEIIPCLPDFLPNVRERRNERFRPTWSEVETFPQKLDTIPETANWRRFWHELPHKHTEAWYVQQALTGTWPAEPDLRSIWLVCRPNLDVFRGSDGQYTRRYGNLRLNGVDDVLSRAVADGPYPYDEIWFTQEQLLPVQELAVRFGNSESLRIHAGPASVSAWWWECARRANLRKK